jgi:hypothetical protein
MSWVERLRAQWEARRRKREDQEVLQLEAEVRGEAAALRSRKDLIRDQRYSEDYPSRGGGVVGH